MATAARLAKASPLQPEDWIRAALGRLSEAGVDAVCVEVLARDLNVSKGSFYWHFRDRQDLLGKTLALWERRELDALVLDDTAASAATRWARMVQTAGDPARIQLEASVRSWARRDEQVARCVAAVEQKKMAVIANVLQDIGFSRLAAEACSEVVLLLCLGWVDRATRDSQFQVAGRRLGELLSEIVLAASSRVPAAEHSAEAI
ncbi:MAG TPA: helix-turn-helix domain-containing protein [Candidatus Acidoferrales bacterium]|jgi:AcrR family transcriptional regulator|nr:helix-turn-helix domain-containing protein [Candidatus Acidoferrales bacterium]